MVKTRGVTEKALSVRSICYCFHYVNRFAILYVVYFIILNNFLLFHYSTKEQADHICGYPLDVGQDGFTFLS